MRPHAASASASRPIPAEELGAGFVHFLHGGEVAGAAGDPVEFVEGDVRLEEALGSVEAAQPLAGRLHPVVRAGAAHAALLVDALDGERAGAVEVDGRRRHAARELAHQRRRMWMCPSQRRTTLAFLLDEGVVVRVPGARLREFGAQPLKQRGDTVVDVLGAVVGMEADDLEGERPRRRSSVRSRSMPKLKIILR